MCWLTVLKAWLVTDHWTTLAVLLLYSCKTRQWNNAHTRWQAGSVGSWMFSFLSIELDQAGVSLDGEVGKAGSEWTGTLYVCVLQSHLPAGTCVLWLGVLFICMLASSSFLWTRVCLTGWPDHLEPGGFQVLRLKKIATLLRRKAGLSGKLVTQITAYATTVHCECRLVSTWSTDK